MDKVPNAYIIRPPYLCGAMNNVYREAFVFQCAMLDRNFYVPDNGEMKMQFFDVGDLAKFVETVVVKKPENKIFNVGNKDSITVNQWVNICYKVVGKEAIIKKVDSSSHYIRNYFPFANYEYVLDVSRQNELMSNLKPFEESIRESYEWYICNQDKVVRKEYMRYIDENIK